MAKHRVLITGITGMVGSHLAEYLLRYTDWDIYGMCRWRSPLDNIESLIPNANRGDRVFLLYGDLRDTLSVQDVVKKAKPDYVFHLAAQSFPRTSFESPEDTLDTNIQGTVRVLDALRAYSKDAVIHVCSSSEVLVSSEEKIADQRRMHVPPGIALLFPGTIRQAILRLRHVSWDTDNPTYRRDVFAESRSPNRSP